jgi:hypothetical protein
MRRALVVALVFALCGVVSIPPAFALATLAACVGDEPTSTCFNGLRGIATNLAVNDGILTDEGCPSQFVNSIYVEYGTDSSNFIEFGFTVNRNFLCATSPKRLFIDKRVNGSQTNLWSKDVSAGNYRLLILQLSSTPGVFRFQYDPNGCGGGACRVTVPVTWNPSSPEWSSGYALISAEHQNAPDAVSWASTANAWVENASYVWHAANPGQGSELAATTDTIPDWCVNIDHNTGTSGDDFHVGAEPNPECLYP